MPYFLRRKILQIEFSLSLSAQLKKKLNLFSKFNIKKIITYELLKSQPTLSGDESRMTNFTNVELN